MADELSKMCATCPHVGIANRSACATVELTYNGVKIDRIQPNHCHENVSRVCRGSVINILHRERGDPDCGDVVKFVMDTKAEGFDPNNPEHVEQLARHNLKLVNEFATGG